MPASLLRHRHQAWARGAASRQWLSGRYGDAAVVTIAGCGDGGQMDAALAACVRSLREYGALACAGLPCDLAGVPVCGPERRAKMSMYLDMCPVCRTDHGVHNRPPHGAAMARSLVQYRRHVYSVCPAHRDAFCRGARRYADAAPEGPDLLPEPRRPAADGDRGAARRERYRDTCVVCALRRPWHPVYRPGDAAVSANYSKYTFAFCSSACRREFARRPAAYSAYKMRVRGPEDPPRGSALAAAPAAVALHDLPVLGYLEQTVAVHVGRALVRLTAARPLYPGLTARVTAMLFVGLCVGANGADRDVNDHYRDAFRRFVDACHSFKIEVFRLKMIT